jgi:hypothetical protein
MAPAAPDADAYDIPWVEKYRPSRVADVVGNSDAVARLEVIARDGNMPNLILSVSAIPSNTFPAQHGTAIHPLPFWRRGLRGPGRRRASWRWRMSSSGPAIVMPCWSSMPQMTGFCHRDLILYRRFGVASSGVWVGCLMVDSCFCRGLDVVRNKIKMFAQKKVTLQPGRHKIVILDEADR